MTELATSFEHIDTTIAPGMTISGYGRSSQARRRWRLWIRRTTTRGSRS